MGNAVYRFGDSPSTHESGNCGAATSRQQDFRGFVATKPIRTLSIGAPEADGDFVWCVFDNLVVGSAR
jgi:hypothetical protein